MIRHHPRDARPVRRPQQRLPVVLARDIERLARPGEVEAVGGDMKDLINDALGVVVDDVVAEDVAQTPRAVVAAAGFLRPHEPDDVGPAVERGKEVAHLFGGGGRLAGISEVGDEVLQGADVLGRDDGAAGGDVVLKVLSPGWILCGFFGQVSYRGKCGIITVQSRISDSREGVGVINSVLHLEVAHFGW